MKKIIFLICCILNLVAMQSPKPNLTDEQMIEFKLRYSPFERAVAAIIHDDQESLDVLINRNPKLLEIKSPVFSNARLLDIAIALKKNSIARSLILNDNQDLKKDSPRTSLSPLHIAAQFDDEELAKFLVNNGQCPETIDENGIRPISVARERDSKAVFKTFKKHINGYLGDDEQ